MSTRYQDEEGKQHCSEEPLEIIDVYVVRKPVESTYPVIDADKEPQPTRVLYRVLLSLLLVTLALLQTSSTTVLTSVLNKTLTLTLSLHPTGNQVPLFQLPEVVKEQQVTVPATGTFHQDATYAVGSLTFYNGSSVSQVVPLGTRFTGTDGSVVATSEQATVPPETLTTPPTEGTVSVPAQSAVAGVVGNIPAQDINTICCGGSVVVQNLSPFHGGRDAQTLTVVQGSDISNATTSLKTNLDQDVNTEAQGEVPSREQLIPLSCTTSTSTNHHAGDQSTTVTVSMSEYCTPLAYTLISIQHLATVLIRSWVPQAATITQVSILLLGSQRTATEGQGILTVAITATIQNVQG